MAQQGYTYLGVLDSDLRVRMAEILSAQGQHAELLLFGQKMWSVGELLHTAWACCT